MTVSIDIQKHVMWVTLDRARVRNAMNLEMVEGLELAFEKAESDASIRVVVLNGAAPAFCAGSDLKELGHLSLDEICRLEARKARLLRRLALLAKPVVGSVQGPAIGGGAFLAAACDVVIAADDARIQAMEVPNGWITPWGIHVLLTRMAPKHAQSFCWGFRAMSAQEGLSIGLVDEACAVGELRAVTVACAEKLAALPVDSVSATKRVVHGLLTVDAERLDAYCNALFREHCSTSTAQETFRRFTRK